MKAQTDIHPSCIIASNKPLCRGDNKHQRSHNFRYYRTDIWDAWGKSHVWFMHRMLGGETHEASGCRPGTRWLAAAQQKLFFIIFNAVCRTPLLAPFLWGFFFISWTESRVFWATCSMYQHVIGDQVLSGFKSFPFCPSRCVTPMLLAPEAWGEVSQAQAPMGRPVTQHALLLLQCMLVLRPGSVVSRRGPVLLPESPCYKTEHPLIPHSGMYS